MKGGNCVLPSGEMQRLLYICEAPRNHKSGPLALRRPKNSSRNSMKSPDIIERAFQLARYSTTIDEIRETLLSEGYSNVDARLGSASIEADLKKQFIR